MVRDEHKYNHSICIYVYIYTNIRPSQCFNIVRDTRAFVSNRMAEGSSSSSFASRVSLKCTRCNRIQSCRQHKTSQLLLKCARCSRIQNDGNINNSQRISGCNPNLHLVALCIYTAILQPVFIRAQALHDTSSHRDRVLDSTPHVIGDVRWRKRQTHSVQNLHCK